MEELLEDVALRSARYLADMRERGVAPSPAAVARLAELREAFPAGPSEPADVLALLDDIGSPATVGSAGPRFFGFVIGGSLPAALAANWLAAAWDQNAAFDSVTPAVSVLEAVALEWMQDVLGLPEGCAAAFVTGATMANFSALVAARHSVLARRDWDVEADGLFGAPPITVVIGEEAHPTLIKALGLVGFGRNRLVRVPVDGQGRMRSDALPRLTEGTIVCAQAGNVNTGAFDPLAEIAERTREAGAWLHIDGAFGLWAAAAPRRAHLLEGSAPRRLLGNRRAQVAQRPLRQRPGVRARCRLAARRDGGHGRVPAGAERGAQSVGLHARALASRARRRGLGGPALARPLRPG